MAIKKELINIGYKEFNLCDTVEGRSNVINQSENSLKTAADQLMDSRNVNVKVCRQCKMLYSAGNSNPK